VPIRPSRDIRPPTSGARISTAAAANEHLGLPRVGPHEPLGRGGPADHTLAAARHPDSGGHPGASEHPRAPSRAADASRVEDADRAGARHGKEPDGFHDPSPPDPVKEAAATNHAIDRILAKINPEFKPKESAYSENCTSVVQTYEMRRRGPAGVDLTAGPLEPHLRTDHGGPGGRPLSAIEQPWGGKFRAGSKTDIEQAFSDPGSRGVVFIQWNTGGGHVFNVENVGGTVRFVDGQPIPPVTDASYYFNLGRTTGYIRLDDLPIPPFTAIEKFFDQP
jgi:hypothetical protein